LGDLGLHLAVADRAAANPLHPADPMVLSTDPSPYFSPWSITQGLLMRTTGLDNRAVLSLTSVVAVALVVSGIVRFTGTFTARRLPPVLAMVFMLTLWGPRLFAWSGYFALNSLGLTLAYPSTAALGMTLHLWSRLNRPSGIRSRVPWDTGYGADLASGLLLGLILLVHQFTGAIAVLGTLALVAPQVLRLPNGRQQHQALLRLGTGVAAAVTLLSLWPYYDFWALGSVSELEQVHKALYTSMPSRFGFALLGLPALLIRFRRDRLDPLCLLFASSASLFALGAATGHYSLGRVWPAVMLAAQIALALELVLPVTRRLHHAALAVVAAAVGIGCWTQLGILGYAVPSMAAPLANASVQEFHLADSYRWITRHVPSGAVLLSNDRNSLAAVPAFGYNTVTTGYPDMFLHDSATRRTDTTAFFASATSAEGRERVLSRYDVGWVVCRSGSLPAQARLLLEPVAHGPRHLELYRVVSGTS
jgi:hypothetical protein